MLSLESVFQYLFLVSGSSEKSDVYMSWANLSYLYLAVWQHCQVLMSTCPGLNVAHHWLTSRYVTISAS